MTKFSSGLNIVLKKLKRQLQKWFPATERKPMHPPMDAPFLLFLFLPSPHRDDLVGDLEERFHLISKKFGTRKAKVWYWNQVLRSILPMARIWAREHCSFCPVYKKEPDPPICGHVGSASAAESLQGYSGKSCR